MTKSMCQACNICRIFAHQGPIKPPIRRGAQVGVVPQQREIPPKAVASIAIALHQVQGLVAVAQAQVALGDDGTFHDNQWALAQAQGAALVQVVEWILATGATAKAGAVGVAQGAVVIQAIGVPQARGGGRLPAQEVLATAQEGLADPFRVQHPAQGGDRAGQGLRVAIGVVAGVDADLMTAGVDQAQQGAQGQMVQADAVVQARVGVLRDEIEGHRAVGGLVDLHDPLDGGAVRVPAVIAAARPPMAAPIAPGQGWGTALEQIARQATRQAGAMRGGFLPRGVGERAVHVATHYRARLSGLARQAGPEALHRGPEDLDVLVDDRPVEKARAVGQRGASRKAVVMVPFRQHGLFVAGEHEEGRAEEVDGQAEAGGLSGVRLSRVCRYGGVLSRRGFTRISGLTDTLGSGGARSGGSGRFTLISGLPYTRGAGAEQHRHMRIGQQNLRRQFPAIPGGQRQFRQGGGGKPGVGMPLKLAEEAIRQVDFARLAGLPDTDIRAGGLRQGVGDTEPIRAEDAEDVGAFSSAVGRGLDVEHPSFYVIL